MFHPSGNTPAVADLRLELLDANQKPNAALNQVAGLLVRMGMARQDSALAHSKLSHQRLIAVDQGLAFNPIQRRTVSSIASLLEHASCLSGRGAVGQSGLGRRRNYCR